MRFLAIWDLKAVKTVSGSLFLSQVGIQVIGSDIRTKKHTVREIKDAVKRHVIFPCMEKTWEDFSCCHLAKRHVVLLLSKTTCCIA